MMPFVDDPRPFARTAPPFTPGPVTLDGRLVRLEPLALDHVPALAEVGLDPELWRWTFDRPSNEAELGAYVERALAAARPALPRRRRTGP
jgi:hypothetical protein